MGTSPSKGHPKAEEIITLAIFPLDFARLAMANQAEIDSRVLTP
jgi:hypothetical protein